jgi:hypothetical protein
VSDLTLKDLRVHVYPPYDEQRLTWRPATLDDLKAVLVNEGAKLRTMSNERRDFLAPGIYGLKPGTYLILRVDE